MRPALWICLILATGTAQAGAPDAAPAWSPDGRWLAYTTRPDPAIGRERLRPGWLVDRRPEGSPARDAAASAPAPHDRLWATRVADGASVLVDESPGWHLGPSWSGDGRSLAFGRVGDDGATLEVVIWEGRDRRRVVQSRPLPNSPVGPVRMAAEGVAWSGDGRYLSVPLVDAPGLALIRVEDGKVASTIPRGRYPAWAPEGSRLACYIESGREESLAVLDSALGLPRPLIEVRYANQPPAWTRDGLIAVVHASRQPSAGRLFENIVPESLTRVRFDSGQSEVLFPLTSEPGVKAPSHEAGFVFGVDPGGEDLFWASNRRGADIHMVGARPRDGVIRARNVILDPTLPIQSLAVQPGGDLIAARTGPAGVGMPPLLIAPGPREPELRALLPDDDARASWLALLAESARSALRLRAASGAPLASRPTLIPYPGELEPTGDLPQRVRRAARLGQSVAHRPAGAEAPPPRLAALLDEARPFFDALRDDYAAAQAGLAAAEPHAATPDGRLALIGLRAQFALGRDDFDGADRTIAFLRGVPLWQARRLEWVGESPRLAPADEAGAGSPAAWIAELAARSTLLRQTAQVGRDPRPDRGRFRSLDRPGRRVNPFADGEAAPATPRIPPARFFEPPAPIFVPPGR